MDETNDLSISLGLDPTDLRNGLNDAERAIEGAGRRISSSLENIGNLGQKIASLGATLTASITVPLIGLATASIQAYGDIQALQKGLESITGSVSVANREFEKLKEVAKLPGIGLQEAVKGSINLQAIGLSAGTARKVLLEFGNAVASVGKGRVEFERAIYGITQLANTPFPLGEDLNIIADALPQVRTLLQDAFGKTRSDDLAKMGVTSKQILDVILKGLGDLPRVSGGIKNSFENLKDSLQQNLARVGKILDDNLDISGIINKVTEKIDLLISKFENLSPGVQKTIIVIAGLAAAIGPVLLAIGGIMAVIPILVNGFQALRTAVLALNTAMLANPYTAVAVGLAAIGAALFAYYSTLENAKDRQNRFNDALTRAVVEARKEQTELAVLYQKTQDQSLAIEERRKAVDALQKQYPGYFGDLKDEIILAGKASQTYQQLSVDITKASRARAAQAELDKRNASRIEEDVDFEKRIKYINETFKIEKYRNSALKQAYSERQIILKDRVNEDKNLFKEIQNGQAAIAKIDADGLDKLIEGTPKVKKEVQRQLAEIIPKGSIADYQKRADLLKKSIEYSVDGLVKVRGLDKFGKDVDKNGNPYYTGLVLPIEKAYEELEKLQVAGGQIDLQPFKMTQKGLLDQFGQEYATFNDFMFGQVTRTGDILGTKLPQSIDAAALKALEAKLKLNDTLKDLIQESTLSGITDVFSALGEAIGSGQNALQAAGRAIFSTIGSFITQFGKELVKTALLSEVFAGLIIAIQNAFGNPYVLLAVGAAAVALGAVISGAVKNTSSTAGGGGGSSSGTTTSSPSNYTSSNFSSGGGSGGEYVFRLSGQDLIAAFNRNVSSEDRVSAS